VKAAVLHAKDDLRYEEVPVPKTGDGEVLVKVRAAGICGSDIIRVLGDGAHYYPIILGHEFAGDVVETGDGVTSVKVGDRVAGVPLIPCMKCIDCQSGNYSQCSFYSFIGSRSQGSFAEYVKLPQQNVIRIGNRISYEQGALFEPSTVALHGLNCADYRGGENVAILGGGTIGLFTAQWAKFYGAKKVFVFDIDNERLALARKLGVDVTINTTDNEFRSSVDEILGKQGFMYIYETAGVDITMRLAFELAANKARVCFIGTTTKELVFPPGIFQKINRKEFMLTGSWMSYSAPFPGKEWDLTAHYYETGQLKFDKSLIFKILPMSRIKEGFDLYKTPGNVKGKIILVNE
jgi:L-iditol 2-dehydrogenase